MSHDIEAIKRRILALMAKTTENGCTEQEAMAASAKVQQMLHEYQLDLSDIEIKESKCVKDQYDVQQKAQPAVYWTMTAIGYFTDTKIWFTRDKNGFVLYNIFGLEHDVMIAKYITKICDWACIWGGEEFKQTDDWKNSSKQYRVKMKHSYQYGMACRLAERLREMKDKQRFDDKQSTGRDLVVVKNAVVEDEFAKIGLSLTKGRHSRGTVDAGAYNAGRAAGDKVAINPGVANKTVVSGHITN